VAKLEEKRGKKKGKKRGKHDLHQSSEGLAVEVLRRKKRRRKKRKKGKKGGKSSSSQFLFKNKNKGKERKGRKYPIGPIGLHASGEGMGKKRGGERPGHLRGQALFAWVTW